MRLWHLLPHTALICEKKEYADVVFNKTNENIRNVTRTPRRYTSFCQLFPKIYPRRNIESNKGENRRIVVKIAGMILMSVTIIKFRIMRIEIPI